LSGAKRKIVNDTIGFFFEKIRRIITMKKVGKKLISVCLCTAMALSMLAGCGSSKVKTEGEAAGETAGETANVSTENKTEKTSDMPVVNFVMPSFSDFSDAPAVEKELNTVLGEKYGIQTKLTYISIGAWVQQSNLLLTGDEADVVAVFISPLSNYVTNGQLLPLDDYFNNSSDELKSIFLEGQMNSTQVDGTLYSLSNFKDFAGSVKFIMDEKIVNDLGIDVDGIKSLEDIEPILAQVKEAYPEIYGLVPQHDSQMLSSKWTWDYLGVGFASAFVSTADYGQSTKVECTYELDDFVSFTNTMHDWYEKGYVMADALSNTEAGDALILGGKAFGSFANGSVAKLKAGLVGATIIEPWSASSAYTGVSYGINANSKNPDAAWKLIEAIYTDTDVATLLIDGIEGTHYVNNEDGTINFPEGIDASTTKYGGATQAWLYPNATLTHPIITLGEADYFDKLMAFNNGAKNSKEVGFMFNTSKCADAFSACLNVHQKYFNALLCGVVDPNEVIPEAIQEMKAAGLEDVIAEEQAQLDTFLAK